MPRYTAPIQDMQFLLHEVLDLGDRSMAGYEELDRDFTGAVLAEAGKLATEVLAPLNAVGDRNGCTLNAGTVTTPQGFREAYAQLQAGGWMGLDMDPAYGGQGMPYLLGTAVGEMFVSANMAFNMYQGLTHGAASTILAHGSEEQKQTWLPNMISGAWTGTMNLTESHAGTDLGMMRTRAEPQDDGTYRITGQKIFISAGDHDLTENIVHLVLAKAPGGGEGTKGISLFIVPKFLVNADGSLGARNGVVCSKVEDKMGIHGNATCVMDYDGATGYLLGELHDGMRAMFTMMNEARIGVGLQGYAQAAVAYQNARDYALDRLQGRAINGAQKPDAPADPLIVHPDIRRMLLDQKSFVEGARAFTLWGAHLIDQAHRGGDADAEGLISLLTPVIKGFQTDRGFDMTVQAQQVFGGHGYIEETGMSQFVRDARIAMIYEGANGIQALDLVGRKLAQGGGKQIVTFFGILKAFIRENQDHPELKTAFLDPLDSATKDLQAAVMYFMKHAVKDPNTPLAGSTDFLHMLGHVCFGLMWARMARASLAALKAETGDKAFYETKLETGRYYMARQLPTTALHLARIQTGGDPIMTLQAERF